MIAMMPILSNPQMIGLQDSSALKLSVGNAKKKTMSTDLRIGRQASNLDLLTRLLVIDMVDSTLARLQSICLQFQA